MAKYTVELRTICDIYGRDEVENWFKDYNLDDYLMPNQIEQLAKYNVFNKEKLARMIVDHYYMREIGFETPALFKHYAKVEMQEIIESYLLTLYTKFLEYNPLSSVDYDETYTREIEGEAENTGSSSSNSQSNGSGLSVNSDTPQGQINKNEVLQGKYASNVNASETENSIEDETNTQSSGTSRTVETYTHHMEGDNGVIVTNQYLVREFRELAVNIYKDIIHDLQDLFMGLY